MFPSWEYLSALERAGYRKLTPDGYEPVECPDCNGFLAAPSGIPEYPSEVVAGFCAGCARERDSVDIGPDDRYCSDCSSDGQERDLLDARLDEEIEATEKELSKKDAEFARSRRERLVKAGRERIAGTAKTSTNSSVHDQYMSLSSIHSTTDNADAYRMVIGNADRLLLVNRGGGVYRLMVAKRGGRWEEDEGVLRQMLVEANIAWGSRLAAAVTQGSVSQQQSKVILNHLARTQKARVIELTQMSIGKIATDMLGSLPRLNLPAELTVCQESELDRNPRYLGCPQGVIDTFTGKILPDDEARKALITKSIPDEYDPDAAHPDLDRILPPSGFELDWMGYCLSHPPARSLLGQITEPGAGKTMRLNALLYSLGDDYAATMSGNGILHSRMGYGTAAHNTYLRAYRIPRRFVVIPEFTASGATPNVTLINQLTGGDEIEFRDVGEKSEKVRPIANTIIQGNPPERGKQLLGVGSESGAAAALLDRLVMMPMKAVPADQREKRLLFIAQDDPSFRQAYVARLVAASVRMKDIGLPKPNTAMKEEARRMVDRELPLWQSEWLPNAIVRDEIGTLNTYELFQSYQDWFADNGEGKSVTQRRITESAKKVIGVPEYESKISVEGLSKPKKVQVWVGYRLRNDSDPAPEPEGADEAVQNEQPYEQPCASCEEPGATREGYDSRLYCADIDACNDRREAKGGR